MNPNERTERTRPASAFELASLEAELRRLPKPPVPTELEGRLVAAIESRAGDSQPSRPRRSRSPWRRFMIAASVLAASVGLIFALLMPAVHRARSVARLSTGGGMLRGHPSSRYAQWGVSQSQKTLPGYASSHQTRRPVDWNNRGKRTWTAELLPFTEQTAVFDALNFDGASTSAWKGGTPANWTTMRQRIEVFLCPSDSPLAFDGEDFNTEAYDYVVDNAFVAPSQYPLSTFSIDVDTAAYANMRRFLTQGMLPPAGSVRIEELINYFSYKYSPPEGDVPFSANVEIAECPWLPEHRLVRIGLKGREIEEENRPLTNLVFLLDVSGSMQPANKLPLLKRAMQMLVKKLGENDRVAIVVYAGASGLVLPSTTCDNQETILSALDDLQAGGSTNGGEGIQLAYDIAAANFIKGGVNRVILCTDGDFNVGITNQSDLIGMIEKKAKSGVFLSVLGFGMGNLKDSTLEKLADKGNGNYGYIDTLNEAKKVFVDEMGGTLITIAKDVKIQIEFNPARVAAYRLIGYENRLLAAEDFDDDTKDAGEIGAGHTVTALYEIVPAGKDVKLPGVQDLKYQKPASLSEAAGSDEVLTLYLRYKQPDGDTSRKLEFPIRDGGERFAQASSDFKFAAAVASFGMLLRESPYKGNATFDAVAEIAQDGKGEDPHGYRAEFLKLVAKAKGIPSQ